MVFHRHAFYQGRILGWRHGRVWGRKRSRMETSRKFEPRHSNVVFEESSETKNFRWLRHAFLEARAGKKDLPAPCWQLIKVLISERCYWGWMGLLGEQSKYENFTHSWIPGKVTMTIVVYYICSFKRIIYNIWIFLTYHTASQEVL